MDTLRANKKTTEEFTEKLQKIKNKYKVKQLDMRENLLKKSQEQLTKLRNNNDDENIGCPTDFCDELTKAKIAFDNVKVEQKKEEENLMEKYVEQIIDNMNIESVKKVNSVDLTELSKEEADVLPCQAQGKWYINKMNEIKVRVFESMVNSTTPGWEPIYEEIGKQLAELSPQFGNPNNYKIVHGPVNKNKFQNFVAKTVVRNVPKSTQ